MNEFYRQNRQRVLEQIDDGIMIVPTNPQAAYSHDVHYKFRHNSDLHYLTGFPEPEAVLVLSPKHKHRYTLFVLPRDLEKEIWNGFRHGVDGARETFGADAAYPIDELAVRLPEYLEDVPTLHHLFGVSESFDRLVLQAVQQVRRKVRQGILAPETFVSPGKILHEMRLFKQPYEIDLVRKAASITAEAHQEVMRTVRPGVYEYELEALLDYRFKQHGAAGVAYPSIVGGGVNATILHYIENRSELRDGDILLVDAGCEFQSYNADLTRSFPVNGKFSAAQRTLYELVLTTQKQCINLVRPGTGFMDIHDHAVRILTEGFKDLKLLAGSTDELIETEAYKKYYMHKTGHWLGMDVHDVGNYRVHQEWRKLEPGMVLTVEPGIYFGPHLAGEVPTEFLHVGIRIEDDVLVTSSGHEVLTSACPKEVADIEQLMASA